MKEALIKLGYERAELVEARGQFSLRGDILDIALTDNKGVRIEFWGEEIDSIRYFNLSTQRSIEELRDVTVYPAHEYILIDNIDKICEQIENENDIEQIQKGNYISKIDKYTKEDKK